MAIRSIRILPPELQNQIAAGEVVERPASVVKELVENALDASADRVQVSIEGGGQSLIHVQDNGEGLSSEEIDLALTRHATSKVSSLEDLQRIASFGFRGEALPSIASVSRLDIASVKRGNDQGSRIRVEFGQTLEHKPFPLREGTRIEVRDLFVNTPARLKFLKKQATEQKKCQEIMQRFALANLEAAFEYTAGGRRIFCLERGQTLQERLAAFWPPQVVEPLLPVAWEQDGVAISGLTGSPQTAQGRSDRILFFVNRRPVQDKVLLSAVRQAYSGKLLSREYPQAVLFLELPPEEIDVNVHPAKTEIRFRDEQHVFASVHRAISQGLGGLGSGPPSRQGQDRMDEPALPSARLQRLLDEAAGAASEAVTKQGESPSGGRQVSQAPYAVADERDSHDWSVIHEGRGQPINQGSCAYLGQVGQSYLLIRQDDSLLIVDQHAAHERILYNGLKDDDQAASVQTLALPLELSLHASEQAVFQEIAPQLARLGFLYDWPGSEVVYIRGIPAFLSSGEARDFLRTALTEGSRDFDQLWTLLACKRAVKAGDTLTDDEARQLLETWLAGPDREYCPHGRPVAVRFTGRDLDRLFKR